MNASALQTATVTVKYVGPPKEGKQYGFIKAMDNSTWPVKADRIREFEADNEYEIAWTEGSNGFKNIIGVKKIVPQAQPQPGQFEQFDAAKPSTKPAAAANQYYRPTAPQDARRMFITATLGKFIATGRISCNAQAIAAAVKEIAGGYDATIGQEDS